MSSVITVKVALKFRCTQNILIEVELQLQYYYLS